MLKKPMFYAVIRLVCLALAFTAVIASAAFAERRVALLIGNSDYAYTAALANPVRDIALIGETLSGLGFEVSQHENLTRDEIGQALSAFLRETSGADVTLFYFAGHGMQFDGSNYLVGVDGQLASEFDIDSDALDLNRVVAMLERNSRAAMVFIDACRNNPLAESFYRNNYSETRALATRGLAPIEIAYQGTMITFSASPGQVAYDGDGNSPFAVALARHLPTENIEILSAMKRVIRDVRAMTGDRQVPMLQNDLTTEIYLQLGDGDAGTALAYQQEETLFEAALLMQSQRAWEIYFQRFPNGFFNEMAVLERQRLIDEVLATTAGVDVSELTPETRLELNFAAAETAERALGLSPDDVKAIQAALNSLGYDAGPVDGQLGRGTRQAVANYQLAIGLPSTGVITNETAAALGVNLQSEAETSPVSVVSSRDARRYDPDLLALIEDDPRLIRAVRALQEYELLYGFYDGRIYIAVNLWRSLAWDDAVALGESAGGHLATLTTVQENQFALDLVKYDDRMWSYSRETEATAGPGFGLYQAAGGREPDGGWTWVTGEPFEYHAWITGQPNNWDGIEHWANFQSNRHIDGNTPPIDQGWRDRAGWDDLPSVRTSLIIEIE